jgi:acyl carrier protein
MQSSLDIKVREIIAGHFGIDPEHVTDEAHFRDDLGADWLDRLEVIIAIEDQVSGFELVDVVADQIDTVGDLMRALENSDGEAGETTATRMDVLDENRLVQKKPGTRPG